MASLIGLDLSKNLSYFTVPVAFFLAFVPHTYGVALGGFKNFDNAYPRTHQDKVGADPGLDSATKARVGRAHAASSNAFETLGFYAAAVIAANQAGLAPRELNILTFSYIISRVLYIYAYLNLSTSQKGSYVRSLVWTIGVGATVMLYVKAGLKSMNNTLL